MSKALVKLCRPHHYIKNTFVFIGVLFAHQWEISMLLMALWAFIAFSLTASAVYILNDLIDIEADRAHPTKCQRPLASGAVSTTLAKKWLAGLMLTAIAPSLILGYWQLALLLLTYIGMNIAYSLRLKHIVLLDVFIISTGFMLRILAGTVGLGIAPSEWLFLCGMMLTLFLGFCKRTSELMHSEQAQNDFKSYTRKVLEDYSPALLNQLTGITAACTILCYGLYTVSPTTLQIHNTSSLIYTLPIVCYGIFRYLYLNQLHAKGTDTAKDLLTDKHLFITAILWVSATLGVLVWPTI